LTPEEDKPIEQFRAGDLLLSRSEFDPDGPVEAKVVEEVFARAGRVLHLRVGGQVIRTTAEHPFYAYNRGWVPAGELRAGDRLAGHDGRWVPVEEALDTGEVEAVYNLRVADFHTYFVGRRAWGFSAWAHNAYLNLEQRQAVAEQYRQFRQSGGVHADFVFRHPGTGEPLGRGQIRGIKEIINTFPDIDRTGMPGPKVTSQPGEAQRQNRLIADLTDQLDRLGHDIVAGGRNPDLTKLRPEAEILIPPGGAREVRRPDILAEGPIGPNGEVQRYAINVGPHKANGLPTKEEAAALADLQLAMPGRVWFFGYGQRNR
jgi:hypothetical protein